MALQLQGQMANGRGPILPALEATEVQRIAWHAHEVLLKAEIEAAVAPVRSRVSALTLSEIVDQIESGESAEVISDTLHENVRAEARTKFGVKLTDLRQKVVDRFRNEALAEGEAEGL